MRRRDYEGEPDFHWIKDTQSLDSEAVFRIGQGLLFSFLSTEYCAVQPFLLNSVGSFDREGFEPRGLGIFCSPRGPAILLF